MRAPCNHMRVQKILRLGRGATWAGSRLLTSGLSAGCGRTSRTVLEIGFIPARTLELETGSRDLLAETCTPTSRALRQRCVIELLQHILCVAASCTVVSINRHGKTKNRSKRNRVSRKYPEYWRASYYKWPVVGKPVSPWSRIAMLGLHMDFGLLIALFFKTAEVSKVSFFANPSCRKGAHPLHRLF